MAALSPTDLTEPVIASSNRYADIEPYVKGLFAEAPQRWSQILPWQFPEKGTKEQEQEFLRHFFTEREIRKQGGADGPGNGFRFLKQVWYTAAKWNLEYRLPAIVNLWFQSNQELLKDPNMKQHILNESVLPSTFFNADEIKLYGDELLVWVVKIIQFHLRPQSNTNARDNAGGDEVTQAPSHHGVQSTKLDSQEPATNAAVVNQAAATTQAVPIVPPPSASSEPAPHAHVSTAHGQTFQGRNFSSGSQPPEDRSQSYRRTRGSYGNKRNSFNQVRALQRPPNTFGDSRHTSNPLYSPYGAPQAQHSPMPPGSAPLATRLPSGGPYPSPVGPMHMPPLPQGQQFHGPPCPSHTLPSSMQQPYGQHMGSIQPHQQMFMQAGVPGPVSHAGAPSTYMHPQPFFDRSNIHPDSRHFSGSGQSMSSMDDKPDSRGKRRDSVQSRGGRGRGGYGGSMRGRGSRGQNSLGAEGQFNGRPTHNEIDASSIPQRDRGFSIQRDTNWRHLEWHPRLQVENTLPQDARHTIPEHGFPGDAQMSRQGSFLPNPNGPPAGAPMRVQDVPGRFGGQQMAQPEVQPCTAGCTREVISNSCQSPPKLIVFSVPPAIDMNEVKQYFAQFGNIKTLTDPRPSKQGSLPSMPPKHYMWVAFADMEATRKCLANKGLQWPGGSLVLEVAREHWDLSFVPIRQRPMVTSGPQFTASQPPQATHEFSARPLPQQEHETGPHDLSFGSDVPYAPNSIMPDPSKPFVPRDAAQTASGVSTPKKGKNNKNKKKKRVGSSAVTTPSGMKDSRLDEKQETSSEDNAPKSPDPSSPTREDNKAKEAEYGDSSSVESSSGLAGVDAQTKVEDEIAPKAAEGDASSPTAPLVDPVITGEEETVSPKSDNSDTIKGPPEQVNKDEDINDDSFHTASGSPEAEAVEDEAAKLDVPTQTGRKTQEDEASTPADDLTSIHDSDSVFSKTPTKRSSPSQSVMKAPVPQIYSQTKTSVDVPVVDTEKVTVFGKDPSNSLHVAEQRSASGKMEAAMPMRAAVKASNAPAIPETVQKPRSKKTPKSKGPEQTESFSIFAKPKEKRKASKAKKAAGKRKGSNFQMTEISGNDGQSNESVETGKETGGDEEKVKGETSKSQAQQDCTAASISVCDANGHDATIHSGAETKSEAPAETHAAANATHSEDDKKQPLAHSQVTLPAHRDTDVQLALNEDGEQQQDEAAIGLGISKDTAVDGSNTHAEVEAAKKRDRTRKKNKGRQEKKRKNKAMAEVTEMSHPGVDYRASTSNFEYKGNDVDSEASLQTVASNDSTHGSPARYIATRAREASVNDSDSMNRNELGQLVVLSEVEGNSIDFDDIASKRAKIEKEPAEADSPEVASSKEKMAKLELEERLQREAIKGKGKAKESGLQ